MPPISAGDILPPGIMIIEADILGWGGEDDRAGHEVFGWSIGEISWVGFAFGDCDVTGGTNEFFELFIGDLGFIDPKAIESDVVDRLFVGLAGGGAHGEGSARNPSHLICIWKSSGRRGDMAQPSGMAGARAVVIPDEEIAESDAAEDDG